MSRDAYLFVKDLRPGGQLKVQCRSCRHHGIVPVARILKTYSELMPLETLCKKLRCIQCGSKGAVGLDMERASTRQAANDSGRPR